MCLRFLMLILVCLLPQVGLSAKKKGGKKEEHVKVNAKKVVEFAIVVNAHNSEAWIKHCLESIFSQSYPLYTIYIVNDASDDNTARAVEDYIKQGNLRIFCKVFNNKEEKGPLANLMTIVDKIPESKVVIPMNGNDWFATPHALQIMAAFYENPNTWLTYGLYQSYPQNYPSPSRAFPADVLFTNSFRNYPWIAVPPRSFYAKLFQLIRKDDLQITNDRYFTDAADAAYMYPILEMASQNHIKYIDTVLYVCNLVYREDVFKITIDKNCDEAKILRAKLPYAPLPSLFFMPLPK